MHLRFVAISEKKNMTSYSVSRVTRTILFLLLAVVCWLPNSASGQASGDLDSDGDGLINRLDLDDDNDGVIDATEQSVANWGTGIWRYPTGALRHSINVRPGVTMSINIANTTPGTFGTTGPVAGGGAGNAPREDPGALGAINDLLVVFDPAGPGTSPINIDVSFSVPVYDLAFIISDVDGSTPNTEFPRGARWDQVRVTYTDRFGTTGLPATIERSTHSDPVVQGNVAWARSLAFLADDDNTGNLLVRVPDGATAFRIEYAERINSVAGNARVNPTARGVGILGGMTFSPDLDRDGIPDVRDNDSDGDGCFDAVEAGFPNVFNNLGIFSNGQLTGNILANGIPAVANGILPSGNIYNSAFLGANCVDAPDTDGDGIFDTFDLDDDNDGIPDNVECPTATPYDVYFYSRAATGFATNLGATITGSRVVNTSVNQTRSFSDINFDGKTYGLLASDLTAAPDGTITAQFTARATSGGSFALVDAIILVDPNNQAIRIDNSDFGYSDVGNWETSVNQNNGGTVGPNSRFVRAGNYGNGNVATFQFSGLPVAINCDSDGDGFANNIDLDSDGDGCADALESGNPAIMIGVGIGADDRLSGPVQPNGIPASADGNGDGAVDFTVSGDYLNQAVQSASCTPPPDKDMDGVPDFADLDDDNDGIPDATEMIETDEIGVDFGFGATDYPNGQRSASLTGPNGITYDISFTGGSINGGFPRETGDYATSGGISSGDQSLQVTANAPRGGGDRIVIRIAGGQPLEGAAFSLYDVDNFDCGRTGERVDDVRIYGMSNGRKVRPTLTAVSSNPTFTIDNNFNGGTEARARAIPCSVRRAESSRGASNGTLDIRFDVTVDELFLEYLEGNTDPNRDPTNRTITIGDIYNNPVEDTDGDGIPTFATVTPIMMAARISWNRVWLAMAGL